MTTRILDRRAVTLGLAGALCMPAVLRGQTSYPDRPINLIVPFAAGGPTDAIARIYAEFISRDLGQTASPDDLSLALHAADDAPKGLPAHHQVAGQVAKAHAALRLLA